MSNLEDIEKSLSVIETSQKLVDSLPVKILMALTSVGTVIDESLSSFLSKKQRAKRQEFVDYVLKNNRELSFSDLDKQFEFIIEAKNMIEAVDRLSHNEKVQYYAYLFRNMFFKEDDLQFDEYEEFKYLIGVLSVRQFHVLALLSEHPKSESNKENNQWFDDSCQKLGLTEDEMKTEFVRLEGLGLCIGSADNTRVRGDEWPKTNVKPTIFLEKFIEYIDYENEMR
ncbi:hypothetical protein [Lactococcus lactis]|jgi:hypothetical protein|uniref:hypothetical protein n=1 Tax=Lactococcus lactis TaxID=1358 RepID=UPI001D18599F|nr:hypothetical protein [Lactococcus lactis]MCC4120897.1 hypothetical protein [Lactococcus lactis]MDT2861552.1 hypothetical protein [Lactococcus lactis]MDT2905213.1 hypothetical protein [Lactococcus lactis]MDT2909888.1 hypothetical protein [Lactococcus lactis]MDT2931232.1 hypothetical protein [Lactococcus lactis]